MHMQGRMLCEDRGRLWCEAAASLGTPRTAKNQQKLGRGKGKFFPRLQRENGPDDSLILDFKPLELWQNTVLSFQATKPVVIRYKHGTQCILWISLLKSVMEGLSLNVFLSEETKDLKNFCPMNTVVVTHGDGILVIRV